MKSKKLVTRILHLPKFNIFSSYIACMGTEDPHKNQPWQKSNAAIFSLASPDNLIAIIIIYDGLFTFLFFMETEKLQAECQKCCKFGSPWMFWLWWIAIEFPAVFSWCFMPPSFSARGRPSIFLFIFHLFRVLLMMWSNCQFSLDSIRLPNSSTDGLALLLPNTVFSMVSTQKTSAKMFKQLKLWTPN